MSPETMRPGEGDLINGKYRLVRLLGEGGMGSVFEARHEHLGTAVALKFLHPELAKQQRLVARFVQEAQLSATIKSHHVARVTDIDQSSDGLAYLVMEFLQGDSLQTILARDQKLPIDVALDYTLQMLAGLEAAHERGVVHRDLKPDNVFVVPTPQGPLIKLIDFGIAKLRASTEYNVGLTRPGVMMGTPEYMAPEQVYSAESVDARADVYSIGAMLYEMLAGVRPTQGDDAQQIAAFTLAGNVVPLHQLNPAVPQGLAEVVHHAMAANPEKRFASAAEMRNALLPYFANLSTERRLAATPAPIGGVAPTLPPGPGDLSAPGLTQPRTPMRETPMTPVVTPYAAPWAAPATPGATPHGYPPIATAPTKSLKRTRRGRSGWLFVGALVAVAVAAGTVVLWMSLSGPVDDHGRSQSGDVGASPTGLSSPVTPTVLAPAPIAPPVAPQTLPVVPATARPATKPQRSADASAPDAAPGGPPVFTLPGLPPIPLLLPSSIPIPALPSGFPAIPGFPGFPAPAPAGSK